MTTQITLIAALSLVHIFAWRLISVEERIRKPFLSFVGGTAIAYVFLHLLPELSESHEILSEFWGEWGLEDYAGYVGAAFGLVVFYGLERMVTRSRNQSTDGQASRSVFWIHVGGFAVYNYVIGHLLASHGAGEGSTVFIYFIAMAFHFVTTDMDLYEEHKETYSKIGRWVVIAFLIFGWVRGSFSETSEAAFASLFAFVAGSMIMNVMKEELPEAAQSRFVPFLLGVISYGILIHLL